MTRATRRTQQTRRAIDAIGVNPQDNHEIPLCLFNHLHGLNASIDCFSCNVYYSVIHTSSWVIDMQPKRKGITVSLPPDMARQFERLAKAEAKNKSQLFRDMIRVYQQHLRNQE